MDSNQLSETNLVDVQVAVDENHVDVSDLVDVQIAVAENSDEIMEAELLEENTSIIKGKSHMIQLILLLILLLI